MWTPDGRIAYASHAEERYDWPKRCERPASRCGCVWTSRLDGTRRRALVRGRDAHWSPDGRAVVFTPPDGGVAGKPVRVGPAHTRPTRGSGIQAATPRRVFRPRVGEVLAWVGAFRGVRLCCGGFGFVAFSAGTNTSRSSRLRSTTGMARAGIEPATPRFSVLARREKRGEGRRSAATFCLETRLFRGANCLRALPQLSALVCARCSPLSGSSVNRTVSKTVRGRQAPLVRAAPGQPQKIPLGSASISASSGSTPAVGPIPS